MPEFDNLERMPTRIKVMIAAAWVSVLGLFAVGSAIVSNLGNVYLEYRKVQKEEAALERELSAVSDSTLISLMNLAGMDTIRVPVRGADVPNISIPEGKRDFLVMKGKDGLRMTLFSDKVDSAYFEHIKNMYVMIEFGPEYDALKIRKEGSSLELQWKIHLLMTKLQLDKRLQQNGDGASKKPWSQKNYKNRLAY